MSEQPFSPDVLRAALFRLPAARRYRVAYSGGIDSHALLHAFSVIRPSLGPVLLDAVHVNHRLHSDADDWADHGRRVCAGLDIPIEVLVVDAGAGRGESPEAAARAARYRALAEVARTGDMLCTAHHREDQVETLLLRLVRGAGARGLAAMKVERRLGRGRLARPLLSVSGRALADYAHEHQLQFVVDPSNECQRYDRNFLRHEILPRLRARWPGVDRTLQRAVAHQREALILLDSLADADLQRIVNPRSGIASRVRLAELSPERSRNCLRRWIEVRGLPPPTEAHLRRIQEDLLNRPGQRSGCVSWPGTELRAYRDELYAMAPLPAHDATQRRIWHVPETLMLAPGRLLACSVRGRGLDARRTAPGAVEVRFRRGGERCRPSGRAHGQRLKKLYQEYAVPPWRRDRVPLVYVGGELAAVAGLWICEGFEAPPGLRGWELRWEPHDGCGNHPGGDTVEERGRADAVSRESAPGRAHRCTPRS